MKTLPNRLKAGSRPALPNVSGRENLPTGNSLRLRTCVKGFPARCRLENEIWKDGIANIDEMLNGVGKKSAQVPGLLYPFSNHAEAVNTVQRWFVEETRLGIPVDFTNEGIHGLNHTKATPLPAPIAIGSTWNKELVRRAGVIAGQEAKALGYTNVYAPILDIVRDPRWGRTLECYGEEPYLIAAWERNGERHPVAGSSCYFEALCSLQCAQRRT